MGAKTSRSRCKTCNDAIAKASLRCGMMCYSGGRTVTMWTHAACFLASIGAEYCNAKRGRCRGSEQPFEKGDLRISFGIGCQLSWWRPDVAAMWTSRLVAGGLKLETVKGLEMLDEEHRKILLD